MYKFIPFLLLILILYSCEDIYVDESYWPNGKLKTKITYQKDMGKGRGLFSFNSYYESGAIQAEGFLLGEDYHGEWKEFYLNGQLLRESQYHEGRPLANFTEYHANGQLRAKYRFNKDSKLQGTYQLFDLEGAVFIEGEYHQGEKYGKWIYGFDQLELQKMRDEYMAASKGGIAIAHTPDPIEKEWVSYWTLRLDEGGSFELFYQEPPQMPPHLNPQGQLGSAPLGYGKDRDKPTILGPLKKETELLSARKLVECGDLGPKLISYWENGEQIIKEGSGVIERKVLLEKGKYVFLRQVSYDYIGGYSLGSRYLDLEIQKK